MSIRSTFVGMSKRPPQQHRTRKVRSVTIDERLVRDAMKLAFREAPPVRTVTGMIDKAMAEFIQRRQK